MTAMVDHENPFAGQGAVLLDIGGDIGALVVTMPAELSGQEVEIRPTGHDHGHGHAHGHAHSHGDHDHDHHHTDHDHVPHVAVVDRPAGGQVVPSLVFPELVEGEYALSMKGTTEVRLVARVTGGEVTTVDWSG